MLKFLGKIGKGLATIVGLGGATAGGAVLVSGGLNETLTLLTALITALSALLASFGLGRKSGYSANAVK